MTGVLQKRAGVAVLAIMLGAGTGWAAPYSLVTDGPDRAWVLNERSGEVKLCRATPTSGPKVIDIVDGRGEARETAARAAGTACVTAMRPGRGTPRQNYTGYAMYAPLSGLSTAPWPDGRLPDGILGRGFPYTFNRAAPYTRYGRAAVVVVRPDTVNIEVD